jgi:hypothetical protein
MWLNIGFGRIFEHPRQMFFFGVKFCHLATKEKGCGDGQPQKDFIDNIDQSHHMASIN